MDIGLVSPESSPEWLRFPAPATAAPGYETRGATEACVKVFAEADPEELEQLLLWDGLRGRRGETGDPTSGKSGLFSSTLSADLNFSTTGWIRPGDNETEPLPCSGRPVSPALDILAASLRPLQVSRPTSCFLFLPGNSHSGNAYRREETTTKQYKNLSRRKKCEISKWENQNRKVMENPVISTRDQRMWVASDRTTQEEQQEKEKKRKKNREQKGKKRSVKEQEANKSLFFPPVNEPPSLRRDVSKNKNNISGSNRLLF